MRSLIAYSVCCSLGLLCLVGPAAAALPVTTGETDSGEPPFYTLVIVDPQDGAVIPGAPDAVVPVTIEFTGIGESYVGLEVDGMNVGNCADQPSPCTLEVSLAAGNHTLVATGQVFADEAAVESTPVTIEVKEGEATDTSGAPTSSDSGSEGSSGSASTDGTDGTTGGEPGGDKGCACSSGAGAPDLLGLALAVVLAPWRRRRPR